MFSSHAGELAALATAFVWTITALCFEKASKKIGDMPVNIIRLVLGLVFLSIFTWLKEGLFFPCDASMHAWIWLSFSGIIGFVMGDLFLFRAFVLIGARVSMLIMALVPPITAIMGWLLLGEILSLQDIIGMALTMTGIALVILKRDCARKKIRLSHPVKGLLFAFGGAAGQAIGLILSKYGMGAYDAFQSTQIRIFAGIFGMGLLYFPLRQWRPTWQGFRDRAGMFYTGVGAFFGPFLGVSFSLVAVKYALAGVASTIMSIVPILIIPPAVFLFHERVNWIEIAGAFIAVGGVALLFL